MSDRQTKIIIGKYQTALRKQRVPFYSLYLFGSRARGAYHKGSDIDVAVVFSKIYQNRFVLQQRLKRLATSIHPLLEPVVVEQRELQIANATPLTDQIRRDGKKFIQ